MKKERMVLPNIIRRLLFAWLLAANFSYLRLSERLRKLDGTEGLKVMSFTQMVIVIVALVGLLSILSRKMNTGKMERWGIFIAFTILTAFSLRASFPHLFSAELY